MSRLLLVSLIAVGACTRQPERPAVSSSTPTTQPDTTPPAAPAVVTPAPPVTTSQVTGGPGKLMMGSWDIFPTGVAGPHLSFTVSSAEGPAFSGRLTRALAGDVIMDAERFLRFTGRIKADSTVSISISWLEKGVPPVLLAGKANASEWKLSRFVWGGEEQVLPGRTWTVRKTK